MEYVYTIVILGCVNVILASGFNLILGYGGLVSIAHPIFYAIGGYVSALVSMKLGVPPIFAVVIGTMVSAIASVGLSVPSLRISGDYLVIASIGFQLGLVHILNNLEFTGQAGGLSNIPSIIEVPGRALVFCLIMIAVAGLCVLVIRKLVNGDFGRAIIAMRDDEEAFSALGRNPIKLKVVIFAVGSGMAGFAGSLYAHFFLYLTPDDFGIFTSAALLTMVVVGGAATTWGPAVGAVLLTVLPEAIKFLDLPVSIMAPLQGVIFTLLVIFFLYVRPQGLLGGGRRGGGLEVWASRGAYRGPDGGET
jgi:branched-chain amino acid transport system permease protein